MEYIVSTRPSHLSINSKQFIWLSRCPAPNSGVLGLCLTKSDLERQAIGAMGLLPDKQYCGCACAGNAGNAFPVTAGKRSRHASRHVRHARAVMHAGIANLRFPLKSATGENVPGIPGACGTCNFTYLVRGPWCWLLWSHENWSPNNNVAVPLHHINFRLSLHG